MIETTIQIQLSDAVIPAHLVTNNFTRGLILFAHDYGNTVKNPRSNYFAAVLQRKDFSTLLFDPLTVAEERNEKNLEDIRLYAQRLDGIVKWLRENSLVKRLPLGILGWDIGADSAIRIAFRHSDLVKGVTCLGARIDPDSEPLDSLSVPILFIVGEKDIENTRKNKQALNLVKGKKKLEIVPGASHSLDEPESLDMVADLATYWFLQHVSRKKEVV